MTDVGAAGGQRVFRNNSFLVLGWILIVVGAGGGLLAVFLGNVATAVGGSPVAALTATCGWLGYARPRVVADDSGVTVVNPFRGVVRMRWGAISYALVIVAIAVVRILTR